MKLTLRAALCIWSGRRPRLSSGSSNDKHHSYPLTQTRCLSPPPIRTEQHETLTDPPAILGLTCLHKTFHLTTSLPVCWGGVSQQETGSGHCSKFDESQFGAEQRHENLIFISGEHQQETGSGPGSEGKGVERGGGVKSVKGERSCAYWSSKLTVKQ